MSAKSYEFGPFRVDAEERTLFQDGRPVALTPKAFDTLLLLVENAGRLLEKEAMMERLWPGVFVEEANLANNVSSLRKALGDSGALIQTVPRRGYRFTGEVRAASDPDAESAPEPVPEFRSGRSRAAIAIAGAALLALAAGLMAGRLLWRRPPPNFKQVTFRRGIVWNARFQPDAATIVYSATFEGRPDELFVARADQRESRPLGVAGDLLAISRHGDLAILTNVRSEGFFPVGTLARVPITGGAPRELANNVQEADWSPDGAALAVLRWDGPVVQLEYPMGHALFRAAQPAWISHIRIAPDGVSVAFLLHESARFDDRGRAVVVDRGGRILRSSRVFSTANGLAWRGDHLMISASPDDPNAGLYDVGRRGHDRALTHSAGRLILFDIAPDGRALVAAEHDHIGIAALRRGETAERDLSWLDGSWIRDLSADGRTLLFDEEATGGGATAHVYVRSIDGAPATDLGEGHAVALSPDGRWALARQRFTTPPRLILFSTGAGEARPLRMGNVEPGERAAWTPDGKGIVFVGHAPQRPMRTWRMDLGSGRVTPVTDEGVIGAVMSPDGKWLVAHPRGGEWRLFSLAGAAPGPAFLDADELPLCFRADGRAVFVASKDHIVSVDIESGDRISAYTLATQPPGTVYTSPPRVSADGAVYAYTYVSISTELYIVEGLR